MHGSFPRGWVGGFVTYKKPNENTVISTAFWSLGDRIDHTTGSGSRKIKKSVPICSPAMA